MDINMKGAARNCYDGMKAIDVIVESFDPHGNIQDLLEELGDCFIKYQPLLAAYCLDDHFNPAKKGMCDDAS